MDETGTAEAAELDLLRWIAWAQQKAGEEWLRARELTQQQAFALGYLAQNPGAIQRDIAEMTRTTAANVSLLLQGLERRGLVERRADPGDRSKRGYTTDAGRSLIDGFGAAMATAYETILAPLDEQERETFRALLLKLTAHLPRPTRS